MKEKNSAKNTCNSRGWVQRKGEKEGGGEAKNKTGDEERKWKEMAAKTVMRHYNRSGADETRN